MTENTKITCDNCNKDLTYTGNCIDYRLKLMDEIIPPKSSTVTAMMMYPSLKDGSKHFCGIGCLKVWIHNL
jgi:hypothetical protein